MSEKNKSTPLTTGEILKLDEVVDRMRETLRTMMRDDRSNKVANAQRATYIAELDYLTKRLTAQLGKSTT